MNKVTILLLFVAASPAFAQNIQTTTVEWHCASTFVTQPGILTEEVTKVVSSQEGITWYDNSGVARQAFSIVSASGSWNNIAHNGTIIFLVSSGSDSGVVQFTRSEGNTTIRVQVNGENDTQLYELVVNSINVP